MRIRERAPDWLAALMGFVGSTHFVATDMMAETIPRQLPRRRELVLISGVVEVTCAYGLKTRKPWAPRLAATTLLAIWPANIQMAIDAPPGLQKKALWARVPLQLPLVWAALQARPRPVD